MSNKLTITIRIALRGLFRQYAEQDFICVTLSANTSLEQLKIALRDEIKKNYPTFHEEEALASSAFAEGDRILLIDHQLTKDTTLTILPPVCGG
ncbi:MAG: MoaD/ThiS family protein [Gammaproteobacteria bacterium]|nr:MoaD/ThiS family protein [Gammaproteobacteria bacterium]